MVSTLRTHHFVTIAIYGRKLVELRVALTWALPNARNCDIQRAELASLQTAKSNIDACVHLFIGVC